VSTQQKRRAGAAFIVVVAVSILVTALLVAGGVIRIPASATVPTTCAKNQVVQNTMVNGGAVSKCVDVLTDGKPVAQPVAQPLSTWQGVVDYGAAHPGYVNCFVQVTGHPWSDAVAANRAQKAGWKTTVLLESFITDEQANAVLAAQKLMKDSSIRSVKGFINTRTTGCTEFQDNRVQAREALTFPGNDKSTPGETAVLEICANPVGKPGVAVHKVVLPPTTTTTTTPLLTTTTPSPTTTTTHTTPPPTTTTTHTTPPPTTTTTHTTPPPTTTTPPAVKVCYKAAPGCGPNGVNAPSVQSGNPGGTPNYTPGTAEKVTGAQQAPATPYQPNPVYGSNPPAGGAAPPGAGNGVPSGTSAGVGAPSGTPNPGGAVAQPSTPPSATSTGPSGNPCENPNAPGCSH
jgi:hypothetical protein